MRREDWAEILSVLGGVCENVSVECVTFQQAGAWSAARGAGGRAMGEKAKSVLKGDMLVGEL